MLAVCLSGIGSQTYVDHNGLLAHLLQGKGGADGTPIEFDGATNSVDTTAENDSSMVVESHIVSCGIVGCVHCKKISIYFLNEKIAELSRY